ncbi:MAG TPA: Hint domain-containing protein [Polyangiaceae bacterium]|nr:Hint domain-containing protein [Polyangiaceae bacterium]
MHPSWKKRALQGALLSGHLALGACAEEEDLRCFVAGTLVATPSGPRPIESLAVGDEVWSLDPGVGELVRRRVVALHRGLVREVRTLRAGGRSLRGVTPSHPVYSQTRAAFVPVRELREGEALLALEGAGAAPQTIDAVAADERAAAEIAIYNLSVEGPEHTYFADGLLVHNKSAPTNYCPAIAPVTFEQPASPLPADTTTYTVRADYGAAGRVRRDSFGVLIARENGPTRPPAYGPPRTEDQGRTWLFDINDLRPGERYSVSIFVAPATCLDEGRESFTVRFEIDP